MGDTWGKLEDVTDYDWREVVGRVKEYLPDDVLRRTEEEWDGSLDADWEGEIYPLRYSGDPEEKADLLLVGKDYETDEAMLEDFTYFMDFDGEHRGLFAVPPFDDYLDTFNVWAINAGDQIGDWGEGDNTEGLLNDSRQIFEDVPFADYKAVLAKEGMGRGAFAYPRNGGDFVGECWVKGVREKCLADKGAAGLIHEFGHSFGGLSDEYGGDRDPRTSLPNAAGTREEAEELWGHLVDAYDDVGFYQGAVVSDEAWKPHHTTIMGGGGMYSFGPVNELYLRGLLEHEVWRDDRSRDYVDDLYRNEELQDFVGDF